MRALRRRTSVESTGEIDVLRAFVAELRRAAEAAASGDGEARVQHVPGMESVLDAVAVRSAFNETFDRSDAFVREATAALSSISEKRFYRRVLLAGMRGPYRTAADTINEARAAMIASEQRAFEAARAARSSPTSSKAPWSPSRSTWLPHRPSWPPPRARWRSRPRPRSRRRVRRA